MSIPEDPYFAGRRSDKSLTQVDSDGPPPLLAWSWVYIANLCIPVLWGSMVTREGGRVGMVTGIIVVFALGCRACYVSRKAVLTMVYGGWIVAASQLLPILHIFAGMMGTSAARLTGIENDNTNTAVGGFIATLVTGCILMTAAGAFGLAIRDISFLVHEGSFARSTSRRLSKEKDPSFDTGALACADSDSESRSEP
jgi:hypothetical protein